MTRPLLTIAYAAAAAALLGNRIVKLGAADGTAVVATASTDSFLGITDKQGALIGDLCDVHELGEADVTYGGVVTRGDPLTSDGTGRAIAAAPAGGVNANIIGWARQSGVAADVRPITINRSRIQG